MVTDAARSVLEGDLTGEQAAVVVNDEFEFTG